MLSTRNGILLLLLSPAALLVACSVGKSGLGPEVVDASTEAEADGPVTMPEGGVVCTSGVACNGQCLAASDCRGCTGAPLLCAPTRQCAADCRSCSDPQGSGARPIECFACDSNRQNPLGTCEPDDPTQYCLSGDYSAGYADGGLGVHCDCEGGVADCPGNTEVCAGHANAGNVCVTCGEVYVGDLTGQACKGGGTCSATATSCQ